MLFREQFYENNNKPHNIEASKNFIAKFKTTFVENVTITNPNLFKIITFVDKKIATAKGGVISLGKTKGSRHAVAFYCVKDNTIKFFDSNKGQWTLKK